jgi:hypothetical protein
VQLPDMCRDAARPVTMVSHILAAVRVSGARLLTALNTLDGVIPKQVVLRACNPSFRSVRLRALEEVGVIVSDPVDWSEVHERTALFIALLVNAGKQTVRAQAAVGSAVAASCG